MPAPAPLATPAQLGAFLQQAIANTDATALQLLAQASAIIRKYLDQTVTPVSADLEYVTPLSGKVFLSQSPVIAVSKVETFDWRSGTWATADSSTYRVSLKRGTVTPLPTFGPYPCDEDSWRITYDHGFTEIPDDLSGVCVTVAARFYATPAGIDMERTGQRQVKYSLTTDDFNDLEKVVLDGIRIPRVA